MSKLEWLDIKKQDDTYTGDIDGQHYAISFIEDGYVRVIKGGINMELPLDLVDAIAQEWDKMLMEERIKNWMEGKESEDEERKYELD